MTLCRTCGDAEAKVKGQCRACYVYELRTGQDRSDYLARLENRRQQARDRAYIAAVRVLQVTSV